ncbi:MAG TPA: cytochrome P460 family protein [Methylibium sp.]|uniref:cytochrome P460 family protein n=1 Tax=Methylibium sp. TaxID=2067992 RepID=UPI002DB8D3E3|nr:cytochrome P460 family protein [Methylibium sp.]HEU4458790.1 cytochrome P460 family protein [Methylibium sp.]
MEIPVKPRRRPTIFAAGLAAALLAAGCASTREAPPPLLKDGELGVPVGYKTWPKFLSAVQRPDAKQVREIYMNPAAEKGSAAAGFPNGTLFVMENYAAKANTDGTLATGADGKLVKGDLLRVFVMGKNPGWGQDVPDGLKNGNWIYSAFLANGDRAPDPAAGCRACHAPLGQAKDFVHRYDEHFASVKPKSSSGY